MSRKRRWLLWIGGTLLFVIAALAGAGYYLAQRIEPFLKEQTAAYLRAHFNSELEWSRFQVSMSLGSPLRALLEKGKGAIVRVRVDGIVLRHGGRTDIPPLVAMRRLGFEVELSEVLAQPAHIRRVVVEQLDLNIPPKGQRPRMSAAPAATEPVDATPQAEQQTTAGRTAVIIDRMDADGTRLRLLPRDPEKDPLEFDIYRLRLESAGPGIPMQYAATLDNAKPPGRINSTGTFGPWNAEEPGDTPLGGDYTFRDADLSVFHGISGILSSTGKFQGELDTIVVDGETDTPDFRLASSGNPVPLHTRFHAIVDGTNGNTTLDPVEATVKNTLFTAHGSVEKGRGDPARSIRFDVALSEGRVEDLLRLAVKGAQPMLEGQIHLQMKMELLPKKGELADRLRLDGNFELLSARFTSLDTQTKIDTLSRRGQGKPGKYEIANVPSDFVGQFHLEDNLFTVRGLEFGVPGALVQLDGTYTFGTEALDFHGKLRLQARLSKTMMGWKRFVLTPVDPFFAKEGYGTVLGIKVIGTREHPEFGLDR